MGGDYGPSIDGGRVRYFSASSLTTGDENSYGGCPRRYWFKYVGKYPEPTTAAMTRGTKQLHEPIERYYLEGREALPPLVLSGKRYLYEPGPDLLVEREIAVPPFAPKPKECEPINLDGAPLRAAGVPLVGKMDLTHGRGVYIDEDGTLTPEPNAATVEHNDWKSTSRPEYAKTGEELRSTIQMVTYGKYGATVFTRAQWFRLSHTYFLTSGSPKSWKATVLVSRHEIDRRWEYVEELSRLLQWTAQQTDPDKVPANRRACNSFGRGCPHKAHCSAGRFSSISVGASSKRADTNNPNTEIIHTMSILRKTLAATTDTPPTVTPANTPDHVGVDLTLGTGDTLSLLDELEAEAANLEQPGVQGISDELYAACAVIDQSGLGVPHLKGEAASTWIEYTCKRDGKRHAYPPGCAINGSGKLAGLQTVEPNSMLVAIAGDITKRRARAAAPAPATTTAAPAPAAQVTAPANAPAFDLLAPEAPASNPAIAAKPVEGFTPPGASASASAPSPLDALTAPATTTTATPATTAALETATTATPATTTTTAAPETATTAAASPRKRRTKAEKEALAAGNASPSTASDGGTALEASSEQPFELYIDCIPSGPFEMLDAQINAWHAELCAYFGLNQFPDMRCAPKSVDLLSFGAWPGTWTTFIREKIADGALARGRYVILTYGDQIRTVAAEAIASARGKSADGTEQAGPAILDAYVRGVK